MSAEGDRLVGSGREQRMVALLATRRTATAGRPASWTVVKGRLTGSSFVARW